MKTSRYTIRWPAWIGLITAVAFVLSPLPASALDRDGFSRPPAPGVPDNLCWFDPACSVPRGGDSDVMTVYAPDGSIFAQAFAFGAEEFTLPTANVYFFDPTVIPVDLSLLNRPSGLLDPATPPSTATPFSDIFGIATTPLGPALAFAEDAFPILHNDYWPTFPRLPVCLAANGGCSLECPQPRLTPGVAVVECPDILNPVPEVGAEGGDSRWLTIPYDVTPYLSPDFRQLGYTADFRSDVIPEPATLALLGLGLAGLAATRRRRPN